MSVLADENFPRPGSGGAAKGRWDVFSIAEECPGISDEEVAALCADQQRILLTFDKDFGELIFRRGLPAGSGVVLFRITPNSPEEAAHVVLALVESQPDLGGSFCVVTRDRIRVRPLNAGSGR
jgi:predicted nuclease of predicted toxin-antitoxin system